MADTLQILYNGVDAFYPQPVPFVGLEEEPIRFGERWAVRERMTLEGQITGCTFGHILTGYNQMVDKFRLNYQSLEGWQTQGSVSGRVFQKDLVEIESIDITDNRWLGVMPYSITVSCYPSGLFSGVFGVVDPVDSWDFEEQPDATMTVRHNVSCKGFNTSRGQSNALDNARVWAAGRTGVNSTVYPMFISGVSPSNFVLLTQTENIDRFNGTYGYTEEYTNDLARTGYGVIRYSADVQSGNNLITVGLNGRAEGGGQNITGLRYAFGRLDKTAIALKTYQGLFNRTDLNPIPLSQSFSEDAFETTIDFSYSFDNDNSPQVWFDYTVDCSVGTNGSITAAIQGIVRARGGSLVTKLAQAVAYADTVDLYGLVVPFYTPFDVSSSTPLNPVPVSKSRGLSQSEGTVQLNATFNNRSQNGDALSEFNFTLDFSPTVIKVDSRPKVNGLGSYSAVSLGYGDRAALSINGNATAAPGVSLSVAADTVKNACYALYTQYGRLTNATLDQDSITTNTDGTLSFSFAWSFDSPNLIGPETISSLSV